MCKVYDYYTLETYGGIHVLCHWAG